jgi:bifunctional ADP-heptose synthase (sugar kinase/adenylyltransferase)
MTITIIGELCHDTFVYGEVVRLCPEAPVPVLTNIKTENNFGMAGNVKRNLLSFNSSLQINLIHQKKKQDTLMTKPIICFYELMKEKKMLTE